jgi:UDP-N-acetylmuramoylalanine--D-glutamate ligase
MIAWKTDRHEGRTLVVGLGVSGRSVCELLLRRGLPVIGTDLRQYEQFGPEIEPLAQRGCPLRLGEHRLEDFLTARRIILSPGVPLNLEPLRRAANQGVEIIGELEWAWRQVERPVIAVTGTNGKTTTTGLIGEILKQAGEQPFVGGNIGTPLSAWLLRGEPVDRLVLEVSSFQLDTAATFRPDIGVVLNVTEDHLDRYDSFEDYVESKFSLFDRQRESDRAIVNGDDPICRAQAGRVPGEVLFFSRKDDSAAAFTRNGDLRVSLPGRDPFRIDLLNAPAVVLQNRENLLAAVLATACAGVSPEVIRRALLGFQGLPHRMEWVRTWKGIDFINDSKATNVGAVVWALKNLRKPTLLLLGGRDKKGSYEPLLGPLKAKCRGVFLFGEAAPRIATELEGRIPVRMCGTLERAFHKAVSLAHRGDAVVLSPACASFDAYANYSERGDHFKQLVQELADDSPEPARVTKPAPVGFQNGGARKGERNSEGYAGIRRNIAERQMGADLC